MFTAMEYWDEQKVGDNFKFIEEFMKKDKDNIIKADEIQQLQDHIKCFTYTRELDDSGDVCGSFIFIIVLSTQSSFFCLLY